MYQVTFSDQSIKELNKLDISLQMPIIEKFSSLSQDEIERGSDDLGRFERDGKMYYRLRAGDFRIYFEVQDDTLLSHFILHQHSLADFVFRFKLPYKEETLIEQHQSFWQYLENIKK